MDILKLQNEKLRTYIDSHKLRNTLERYEVLASAYMLDKKGPFTASDLYHNHNKKHSRITKGSIYNVLDLLEEADIVVKIPAESSFCVLYIMAYHTEDQFIAICNKCGKVSFYPREKSQTFTHKTLLGRFKVCRPVLYTFGRCATCSRKQKKTNLK
ncbi:Fur family transcriptional regulator [Porphyromonas pogonae]|uniref:Fur family transcriptional regulator n=1 Tax=Porphyromonas pogonae TaxID=867595 RepID=UPI002E75D3DE|nr:transcriptional repressor [Porphyromonas pogonae]